MIKFGYLEGYNSINVPHFNDADTRDRAFDDYTEYDIDAYYPPYYTNVIKLDATEVPQSTPINFVILVHKDKYYYYFVDHFNYINEDIYEIVINMDTVLTYMFDYKITNGLVTRESINRWDGQHINRNYVRENISEGIMEVKSKIFRNTNKYIIITSSKNYADAGQHRPRIKKGNDYFDVPYYVYVLPIPNVTQFYNSGCAIQILPIGYSQTSFTGYINNVLDYFVSDPFTISMIYTESEYLDNIFNPSWEYVNSMSLKLHINLGSGTNLGFANIPTGTTTFMSIAYCRDLYDYEYALLPIYDNIGLYDFSRNISALTPFNKRFVPQLLDENYIQIKYGDITGFTSYPMHQLKGTSLRLMNGFDITTGNDIYYLNDDIYTFTTDKYLNMHNTAIMSMGVTFDLVSDPWKEYQARNKASLTTGLQLQAVNALYNVAKTETLGLTNKMFNNSRALQYFEQDRQGLSDMYANKSFGNHQQMLTGLTDGLMQGINIMANYNINKENLEYAPDTVKGRNNIYSILNSNYKRPFVENYQVNDIDSCARKFEEFGYRVNRVVDTPNYIYDICTNRYYYNFISIVVKTYNLLTFIPNDIINNINGRLENGLRFIDMESLETQHLSINQIFAYDNVEKNNLGGI